MSANYYDWSVVAANNSNSDSDLTWAEGQAPSTVNNSARVVMQRVKQLLVDIGGSIAAGGTANGLTVTANAAFTAYADGMIISFRATASNSGAATLSVNGIGAKAIRKMDITGDVALAANDIRNTGIYVAQYSAALNGAAGAWLLLNPTISIGTLTQPTLILKQSATPTPTAEGDLQWDTDDNVFAVGDGAVTRYPGKAVTDQIKSTPGAFTYTPTPGARFAVFEACGAGAGAGGVNGVGGATSGATGGGGGGFSGRTDPINITGAASFSGSIGAAGAAGTASTDGGNGGNTTITIGATTYTWGGGTGSTFLNSPGSAGTVPGGAGGVGTNVTGNSLPGLPGIRGNQGINTDNNAAGGVGGSSLFGTGGSAGRRITSGFSSGVDGVGFGAGGGGGACLTTASNANGGAGTAGYMRIWEYY